MQGDLKKTYTRSYRISTFKRKMKKRALALEQGPEVKMDTIFCSSLRTSPETDPISLDTCAKDILCAEVNGYVKSDAELQLSVNNTDNVPDSVLSHVPLSDPKDHVDGSGISGSILDGITQTFPSNTIQESDTHIKRPRIATVCPALLGIAAPSPDPLFRSFEPSHPIYHRMLDEENWMRLSLGRLRAPTEILLPDNNRKESTEDRPGDGRHLEDIAMDVRRLRSGICPLAQSLEDVSVLRSDLEEKYRGLVDFHDCDMVDIRILTAQAEAVVKYKSMLGRICAEKDAAIAVHIGMLFSKATQLLDSINLGEVSQGIGRLDMLANGLMPSRHIEAKDKVIRALEEDLQSVTIKASIQEEQIEYLVRQADVLKRSNHALEHCLGLVMASCTDLSKQVSRIEVDHKQVRNLFHAAQLQSCSMTRELLDGMCEIKDRMECLRSDADIGTDVLRIRELVRGSIEKIVDVYESQIDTLRISKQDLEGQVHELSCEVSELRERNASLSESSKYMEEEIELKNTYAKEMESTFEELMKSNRFYEDQLIKSDNALRSLKEKQTKNSMGFASEVERMRRAHLKECGMLKLRIEELELELSNKNN